MAAIDAGGLAQDSTRARASIAANGRSYRIRFYFWDWRWGPITSIFSTHRVPL